MYLPLIASTFAFNCVVFFAFTSFHCSVATASTSRLFFGISDNSITSFYLSSIHQIRAYFFRLEVMAIFTILEELHTTTQRSTLDSRSAYFSKYPQVKVKISAAIFTEAFEEDIVRETLQCERDSGVVSGGSLVAFLAERERHTEHVFEER